LVVNFILRIVVYVSLYCLINISKSIVFLTKILNSMRKTTFLSKRFMGYTRLKNPCQTIKNKKKSYFLGMILHYNIKKRKKENR
jgi:hypothetical protein